MSMKHLLLLPLSLLFVLGLLSACGSTTTGTTSRGPYIIGRGYFTRNPMLVTSRPYLVGGQFVGDRNKVTTGSSNSAPTPTTKPGSAKPTTIPTTPPKKAAPTTVPKKK